MRIHRTLGVPLLVLPLALPALALQAGDARSLQGRWTGHVMDGTGDRPSARRATITEMVITRDRITARDQNRPMGEGTYTVRQGQLDATALDGRFRGQTHLGIYTVTGDTLKWCVANPGRPRPTEMRSRPPHQFLLVMQRVRS